MSGYSQSQSEILFPVGSQMPSLYIKVFLFHSRETISGLVKQRGIYRDAIMELPDLSKIGETDLENNCHSDGQKRGVTRTS